MKNNKTFRRFTFTYAWDVYDDAAEMIGKPAKAIAIEQFAKTLEAVWDDDRLIESSFAINEQEFVDGENP